MFIALYDRFKTLKNTIQRSPAKPHQIDLTQGYIPYGTADAFPLKIAQAVQNSVTASACLQTVSKFIRGSGFTDASLNQKPANKLGETWLEVHDKVAKSYGQFRGFALNIKYNVKAEIIGVYSTPFEYCRLGKPDKKGMIYDIKYNPFFGTGEEQINDTETYDVFNPSKDVVLAQIAKQGPKYKGQMLYFCETTPMSRFYAFPIFAAAENWMKIETNISEFHFKNLDNGFFQSVLLKIIGDPNAPSQHPDDQKWNETTQKFESTKTVAQRFNEEMQTFSGSSRVGNIMTMWGTNKDEWPTIEPFPVNGNQDFFTALSTEATDKIVLAFNVPAILANIQKGATLGGDANQIRLAVKLMQHRVMDEQANILNQYRKIFASLAELFTGVLALNNYNPFPEMEPIDANIWAALSLEEKRKYIKENTKYPILEGQASPAQPAPLPSAKNLLFTDYPEASRKNASSALTYRDKSPTCMTKSGWERTEHIATGMPISYKDVKRVYNFLNKNTWAKDKLMNESCEAIQFNGWGGEAMFKWAGEKIKSIEQ